MSFERLDELQARRQQLHQELASINTQIREEFAQIDARINELRATLGAENGEPRVGGKRGPRPGWKHSPESRAKMRASQQARHARKLAAQQPEWAIA